MKKKKFNRTLLIGINTVDYGSTGIIMRNALEYASKNGNYDYLVITKYSAGNSNTFAFASNKKDFFHKVLRRIKNIFIRYFTIKKPTGFSGYFNTKKVIKKIEEKRKVYKKIAVHIHNVHDMDLDLKVLFSYLAKKHIKVFYTLHDEWAFTGGCYYDYRGCNSWQKKCKKCLQKKAVEKRFFSASKMLAIKKKYFNKLKDNLTLIPVSHWLEGELKKSFLHDFDIVVNNGETSLTPTQEDCSYLKSQLGFNENDKILISVSAYWNEWKGVKYIYKLADKLPTGYKLLIVGGNVDTLKYKNIIHVQSVPIKDLSKYYSIADCFVSITQADNLPLVLMETQICGVPIVGFGHGGTPELITNKSGIMVGTDNNVDKLIKAIIHVVEDKPFKKEDIIKSGNRFKKYESAKRQLKIYNNYLRKNK